MLSLNLLSNFLKLIRLENLIIMVITLWVSHHFIYVKENINLPNILFVSLCISTVFIAAGGYVINDYFDLKIDKINKPDEIILDKKIHRKSAIIWHLLFSILGLGFGLFICVQVHHFFLIIIQLIAILLLLLYSVFLKKIIVLGNLTIGLLTMLLPLLPMFYLKIMHYNISEYTAYSLFILSIFALMTTLIRELIKDVQDMEGDKSGQRNTIPVAWGFISSKIIIFFLGLITILFISAFLYKFYLQNSLVLIYYLALIIVPIILLLIFNITISNHRSFKYLSVFMKLIMISGLLSYLLI